MEVGCWKLLKVGFRYWPQDVIDFIGISALHECYDSLDDKGRRQMHDIVLYMSGGTPVAQEAHSFLEEVLKADSRG